MIFGDFNEIMFSHEKEGGNQRPQNFMQAFRDVVSDCNLNDLGFVGEQFTWRRGRIRERLDRAVVNDSWIMMHPEASLFHQDYMRSDHHPILTDTETSNAGIQHGTTQKFEAKWLQEENFREVVEQA
jgi:endonuclease/exonuclease/phosphatase family metal-dependent hydrolase